MRRALVFQFGLVAALSSLTTTPLVAQERRKATSVHVTAGQMLDVASGLVKEGRGEEAKPIFELLAKDPNSDIRNEARYRHALLLKSEGDYRGAAVLLKRVLDEKPDAAAVRIELAATLSQIGDRDAAYRELRAVRASDLPPNVARFVDRLSASMQARKTFGLQVEFSLAPDTNINRATRSDTLGTIFGDFTFAENSKATSGVGAALRGLANARVAVSENVDVSARISADANLYRKDEFNDITADLAVGPEWRIGLTRLTAEAGVSRQWFGMSLYQRNVRLALSVVKPVDAVSQVRLDGGVRDTNNHFNDLQDGHGFSLRARYERAFSPILSVVASVGGDRFLAEDDAYSTRSLGGSLVAYRDWGRTTLQGGIELGWLKADERLAILTDKREDKLFRLQLGAVFRQLTVEGFAPITRLVFERNKSTVEFYDYRRTRVEVGVSRAF